MPRAFAEIAFTSTVRALQEQNGSASAYAKFLSPDISGGDILTEQEALFIKKRDGFYQASVSESGWPYVQFRGGPKGFLKILDERTLAYADFRGNRQYISNGNLTENNRISIILMDYPNRRRLKIWGRVSLTELDDDAELVAKLHDPQYRARPERAVIIKVEAFDWNCPQHIPIRLTIDELDASLAPIRETIDRLSEENENLRAQLQKQDELNLGSKG